MQVDQQVDSELNSVIDMTAMILVSMKNDPTPPASPISSPTLSMRSASPCPPLKTELCDCMLCTRTSPIILSKCHTWAWIMRVVFYSLRDRYPEKKFFSLKNDVYEYMMNHWSSLGLDRKPSANWHKQIQDMLSHSRNIFESGMTHFKQNGFWRLKDLEDPWTARPDTPRPPSTTPLPSSSSTSSPSSPRKRGWKNTDDEQEDDVHTIQKKLCTPPTSPRLSLSSSTSSLNPESPSQSSSASSSSPPSPIASPLSSSTSSLSASRSDELEKEVAILREQLNHMTESIAQLSAEALIDYPSSSPSSSPSTPPTSSSVPSSTPSTSSTPSSSSTSSSSSSNHYAVFSHNRVWEDSYSFTQHQIGSVQA